VVLFSFGTGPIKGFAVTLFIGILTSMFTSIIGTLVPQKEGAMELAQRISPGLVNLLNALQIFDMYHSFWFRLLIGALALNLIICSFDRLPAFLKRLRALPKPDRSRPFEDIAPDRTFSVKGEMMEIFDGVLETLKKRYGNIQTKETDKGHFFYGEKGRYTLFGFYLVHLSVLLILMGGIIGSFFGFEAYVNIPEGETVETVTLRKSGAPMKLPFGVQCDKFTVEFYENGTPKRYQSDVSFIANGEAAQKGALLVNHPLTFEGITFYQSSYGTTPGDRVRLKISKKGRDPDDSILEVQLGQPVPLPGNGGQFLVMDVRADFMRLGPAVLVLIKTVEDKNTQFWVFQHHESIRERFPGVFEKFPKMNPAIYEPYTFSLENIESRFYTGLQVNKDPGVPLVWLGCFIMVTGFFITFFTSHRHVWVRVSKEKGDTISVSVAGRANKNPVGLERELDQLTRKLRKLLIGEGQQGTDKNAK